MCLRRDRPAPGSSLTVLLGMLILVPLAAVPGFADPYTSVKWHFVVALAAGLLVVERFRCESGGLPAVVARTWPVWAALAVSVVAGSLRNGLGWATEPLTARATFVALALASFWHFRRTRLRLEALRGGILLSALVVTVLGLAQFAGFDPLARLAGGDHRSATFGNVNMAAQFVGLALVVLLAVPWGDASLARRRVRVTDEVLAAAALAYLGLAGTRSVGLALLAAVTILIGVGRLSWARLLRMGTGAALLAGLVLAIAPTPTGPDTASVRESKRASAEWRLAVWSDTLALIRDHPAGVGAGNFQHAFIPYALAGRSKPGEATVFRSPHNEYLRLVAEEGIAGGLLLLALLGVLVRELRLSPAIDRWRSEPGVLIASCGAFLLVEALFQFPFEMAFPSLLAAVLLGLALACTEAFPDPESASPPIPSRGRLRYAGDAACVALSLGIGVGVVRTATAERLAARAGSDVEMLERACTLDPRRVEACVEAAWLRGRAGDHAALREGVASVLRRSPHYFPALKLLGEDLLAQGDTTAGCRTLVAYDSMFGGASSVHGRVRESCPRAAP